MDNKLINFKGNFVAAVVMFWLFKANILANEAKFEPADLPTIKIGDLIFRTTSGFDSQVITTLSDFRYSHIGFITSTEPTLIIHATTNDDANRRNQVILSTLDDFLSVAVRFAISRINFLSDGQKVKIAHRLSQRLGEPFVLLIDSQNSLYCTTLLEKEIAKFVHFSPKYQHVDTAIFEGKYLFPKAFFDYEDIEVIYESETKKISQK